MSRRLSEWCGLQGSCSQGVEGIEQDEKVMKTHIFCEGIWNAAPGTLDQKVSLAGGKHLIKTACEHYFEEESWTTGD